MADQTYIAIPTEVGLVKIQQAMYTGSTLELVSMAYGDGGGEYYYPQPTQTSLVNELGITALQSMQIDTDTGITWFNAIIGANLPSGVIREVGLYDVDGSLCFIANTPEIHKVPTDEGTLIDVPIELGIKNSYSEYITIPLSPSADYATMIWVQNNFATRDLDNLSEAGENKIKDIGLGPVLWEDWNGIKPTGRSVILIDKATQDILIPYGSGGTAKLLFVDYIDIELPIPVPIPDHYINIRNLRGYDDVTGEITDLSITEDPDNPDNSGYLNG